MSTKVVLGVVIGLAALAGTFVAGVATGAVLMAVVTGGFGSFGREPSPLVNAPAPAVASTTIEGEPLALSEFQGRTVLLVFWASWCGPCTAEIPNLKAVHEELGNRDDFVMIGVNLDDDIDAARGHIEEYRLDWLQVHEVGAGWENPLAQAFEVRGIPSIWLIDAEGVVAADSLRGRKIARETRRLLERAPENLARLRAPAGGA